MYRDRIGLEFRFSGARLGRTTDHRRLDVRSSLAERIDPAAGATDAGRLDGAALLAERELQRRGLPTQ